MVKEWKQWLSLFWGTPKSLKMVNAAMKLKTLTPWKESDDQLRQHIKLRQHIPLSTKVCLVKAVVFPVVMYGCERGTIKES